MSSIRNSRSRHVNISGGAPGSDPSSSAKRQKIKHSDFDAHERDLHLWRQQNAATAPFGRLSAGDSGQNSNQTPSGPSSVDHQHDNAHDDWVDEGEVEDDDEALMKLAGHDWDKFQKLKELHKDSPVNVSKGVVRAFGRTKRAGKDRRTRADRILAEQYTWGLQMPDLIKAYLEYRHCQPPLPPRPSSPPGGPSTQGGPSTPDAGDGRSFLVEALELFTRNVARRFEDPDSNKYANVSLLKEGFLSPTPIKPSVAFSLDTLEVFRQLRRHAPRTSVQAFTKVLCALHNMPYRPNLRCRLADTYDVYMQIRRGVNQLVKTALGRDGPLWRLRNACPCCLYKLRDEPQLTYSVLMAADGCSSCKRTRRGTEADKRVFQSDFYLTPEFVDRFQYEVKSRQKDRPQNAPDPVEGNDAEEITGEGACVERWKNARSQAKNQKGMFDFYEETGSFAILCRHGQPLAMMDMRRSGEQAKYFLAGLSHVLTGLDRRVVAKSNLGYDIGCEAIKIARSSELLGPLVKELELDAVMGAFHGYGHPHGCQMEYLPLYRMGVGIEDFEGCERFWSDLNASNNVVRNTTAFRRHQQLDSHIERWSEEKHANLGQYIYSNYRESLKTLMTVPPVLAQVCEQFKLTDDDFGKFLDEERSYIKALSPDSADGDNTAIKYLGLLETLEAQRLEYNSLLKWNVFGTLPRSQEIGPETRYSTLLPDQYRSQLDNAEKQWNETKRRNTFEKLQVTMQEVESIELTHCIVTRWTRESAEWAAAVKLRTNRKLTETARTVESLTVQRMFELEKLHCGGVGYNLRTQVTKGLRERGKALTNAINAYNVEAARCNPPRPKLEFADVVDSGFLSDFALLGETRSEILDQPWTKPAVRKARTQWCRLQRAKEEMERLNVEMKRLRTAMRDESASFRGGIARVQVSDPALAAEIQKRALYQERVNLKISRFLDMTEALPGFSGSPGCGSRLEGLDGMDIGVPDGSVPAMQPITIPASSLVEDDVDDGSAGDDMDEDEHEDIITEQVLAFEDMLHSWSISDYY